MERTAMDRVREILRLRWQVRLSVRQTAASAQVSRSVVSRTTTRAKTAGLSMAELDALDDDALSRRLYGARAAPTTGRAEPDPVQMHVELKRAGVTLELLHLEYLREHPEGYQYTAFCERYRRWKKARPRSMRQRHVAGEKAFVDYSGKRPHYVDPEDGRRVDVELFVGTLGASNYTFVEASATQRLPDWIASHERMFAYFGGVTRVTVPDQLRSAVTKPDWYEPGINRTYESFASHYGTSVSPARPGKPKDKAKAEVAVQVAQRWILARLRNETFFSLAELNARIRELNEELNARPMKRYGDRSRRDLFEEVEHAALLPLPNARYEYAEWGVAKVHHDYHVQVGGHYYSAPSELVHERVDVRATETTIELLHKHRVVAVHVRSAQKYRHTTLKEHMPRGHREWAEADSSGVLEWARTIGPMTEAMVHKLLESRPIAQQGLRSALGLRRVGKAYAPARVEAACALALSYGARSYKSVARLLKLGREGGLGAAEDRPPIAHDNVRGPDSFH
jgi:transposase